MLLYETIILIRRLTEKNLLHRSFDGTDLSHLFEITVVIPATLSHSYPKFPHSAILFFRRTVHAASLN